MDAEDPYPGCLRLDEVLEAGDEPEWAPALDNARAATTADDPLTILYTSGTTSFPKGAVISHRNAVPHGWYAGKALRVTEADRVLHALPMTGTWGGLCIPLSTFAHGACLVVMDTFDAAVALHLIEREGITIWNAVDAMAIAVLDHPDLARRKRSTLRTGGFGMTGGGRDGLFEDVLHTSGVPQAYQPYGMTELNALSMLHDLDESDESRALPGVWAPEGLEVRVVDPASGKDAPVGREGELWFRGPLVTRGYYKKPEETAQAFSADGWFKSGDLGVRDAEGRTIFKGRLREVMRISHFMVAPAEIEAFIMTHPKVSQAFVIGVPDPKMNEAAVAYVIAKPGEHLRRGDHRPLQGEDRLVQGSPAGAHRRRCPPDSRSPRRQGPEGQAPRAVSRRDTVGDQLAGAPPIHAHRATLEHELYPLGIEEHGDVVERVAVHHDEVGEAPLLEGAEVALEPRHWAAHWVAARNACIGVRPASTRYLISRAFFG